MTRQLLASLRALLVATVALGLLYPLAVTGLAQVALPGRADGQLLEADGTVVGSALLGQAFTDADGAPLPEYFQTRPGAYDPLASGASSSGLFGPRLLALVEERRAAVAELEGVDPSRVPADALTSSGSGLDPHISPAYAALQVPRVAAERGLPEDEVRALVAEHTSGRDLGFLGDPRVSVLPLNLALDRLTG
jgi:potassium-transporting ATPase KdpC subunit